MFTKDEINYIKRHKLDEKIMPDVMTPDMIEYMEKIKKQTGKELLDSIIKYARGTGKDLTGFEFLLRSLDDEQPKHPND